jgi:hypothetical protein
VTIDDTAVGGPAYNCLNISPGDVIVLVDDDVVSADDCYEKLIGNDVPGSPVKLTVRSSASLQLKTVTLTRMLSSVMLDNLRMFEVFTLLKDRAFAGRDKFAISQIEKGVQLWTSILRDSGGSIVHTTRYGIPSDIRHKVWNMTRDIRKILTNFRRILSTFQEDLEGSIVKTREVGKQKANRKGSMLEPLCATPLRHPVSRQYPIELDYTVLDSGLKVNEKKNNHNQAAPEAAAGLDRMLPWMESLTEAAALLSKDPQDQQIDTLEGMSAEDQATLSAGMKPGEASAGQLEGGVKFGDTSRSAHMKKTDKTCDASAAEHTNTRQRRGNTDVKSLLDVGLLAAAFPNVSRVMRRTGVDFDYSDTVAAASQTELDKKGQRNLAEQDSENSPGYSQRRKGAYNRRSLETLLQRMEKEVK